MEFQTDFDGCLQIKVKEGATPILVMLDTTK
jgi:hypothetical protein